jgi:hypothetical protein
MLGVFLATFLLVAYLLLPLVWFEVERDKPQRKDVTPKVTLNAEGIPGDPLNVGLIGEREKLIRGMLAIGWRPADPITLETSLKIAESVVLHRPDPDAPVSNLFVFGRKQDLAFEQEVGSSASQRHHVRFWLASEPASDGSPFWVGSATFDVRSGLSHRTGQITHHIDADVDGQRDQLMSELADAGLLERDYKTEGVGPTQDGHNAGGDRYFTDGMMRIGVLATKSP